MTGIRDTIAAIATAPGEAGIAVVRISGSDALAIAARLFRGGEKRLGDSAGGTFRHGVVRDADGVHADEVLLLVFKQPHSYTREDVAEIQCHGGRQSARRVLRAVLAGGARTAAPGEFTRRAFLNGRIDLLQAEAVADLVAARSERAATAAMEQLEGALSGRASECYDDLLSVAADLEASLDFDEGELPEAATAGVVKRLEAALWRISDLLESWEEGHILRDGALVAIAGRPNVGKSTLLNELLGRDRAIVSDSPGTTRDTIEEQVVLGGLPLRLVDTAGLRDVECSIEREGVARAENALRGADLVLYVIDSSVPVPEEERRRPYPVDPDRCLLVLNKTDRGQVVWPGSFPGRDTVSCSLLKRDNVDGLREGILRRLHVTTTRPPQAVISERHRHCLQNAQYLVNTARELISSERGDLVVPAADLVREALESIGQMLGRVYSEELLDSIFARFCVGK